MVKNPAGRLGTNGADEIKAHRWFREINWKDLSEKRVGIIYSKSSLIGFNRLLLLLNLKLQAHMMLIISMKSLLAKVL